ncbi:MAG: two-component system sensor histidine kinase CreC [Candidatus Thiodiazotropha sp. (ex Monitilora ramsayi)]|nr:two-component system sensor histidine kinase CreC [Candidatus Thiodiazotropha sp. (ex Monitilora ramsayi)]
MNLSVRIFLGYFLLIGFAVWFVMRTFTAGLVPGMRQSLEEVLVDTANLLAELVVSEMAAEDVADGAFAEAMSRFAHRRFDARIWFLKKRDPNLIVYITDAKGIVRYDSRGRDLGSDYSRWNDVYKTLRGEYGARTTREDPEDEYSSVMYVAAPITQAGRIIGVVTVGKPSVTVQPFIERAISNMEEKGGLVLLGALALGLLVSYWLTVSIRKLTGYARAVRDGKRVQVPNLHEKELTQLAEAMEAMRSELEGKDYVENYLHSLTHELKSPLALIQGTAELLGEEMPLKDRQRFIGNIRSEARRLHQVVEQLLSLAGLEKRRGLEHLESIDMADMLNRICEERQWAAKQKGIKFEYEWGGTTQIEGERFLLQQAIGNLIDNAIDFSPPNGIIRLQTHVSDEYWHCCISDQGPGIPDYALDKVFERFYSLPRPGSGGRSSGLGLSFVHEVTQLHEGRIALVNLEEGGSVAELMLPLVQPLPRVV